MCAAQSTVRFKRNKDMAKEVIGKGWITVAAINDGKPGSPGSPGSPGKPGSDGKDALTVSASPEIIVLQAVKKSDTLYDVSDYSKAKAQITVRRGSKDVSSQCALRDIKQECCIASVSRLTISIIDMRAQKIDGMIIPFTDGRVTATVNYVENGNVEQLYVTIGVKVEVSALWGRFEKSLSGLSSKYSELSNTVNGLPLKDDASLTKYTSEIKQSAQEISAKVAQETVGRLNLLPGTAFNRETDVEQLNSYFPCKFEPLGGLEGTGAMVASQTGATTTTWCGVKWTGVVLKPRTIYTLSIWARADSGLDDVMHLGLVQYRVNDTLPLCYLILANANETHGWKLFKKTFRTGNTADTCDNITLELGMRRNGVGRCCKLMLDESDTYNGWTAASYADVSSRALEATGIDIKNKTIDMTADKFTLRNNHGEKSFSVDEDGNLEARSLKSVSKDGMLTAVIKDGAFNAKNAMSGASAFFGLVDGLPYLQFTNAAGVVTYAIGATGGKAFGSVKLSLTACNMWSSVADNPVSSDSWLITYGGTITLKNLGQETLSVYKSKLIATIDGFSKKLTPTPSNDSFTMGVTGTNDKMSSVFPGAELVVNFTTITETVKKKNSDGSYNAKPSGYRSVAVVYNNEKIGNGVVK